VRAVEISVRAQLCIERIDTRWRKKADHPDVFRAEMDEIIEHLGNGGAVEARGKRGALHH